MIEAVIPSEGHGGRARGRARGRVRGTGLPTHGKGAKRSTAGGRGGGRQGVGSSGRCVGKVEACTEGGGVRAGRRPGCHD